MLNQNLRDNKSVIREEDQQNINSRRSTKLSKKRSENAIAQ